MNQATDPYLVSSRLGITAVLRTLMTQKTLMHMHVDRQHQAIITTVLDIIPDTGELVVDAAADNTFNQRLAQASVIHFDGQVDKIRVQFTTGPAKEHTFEIRDAFLLPYPETLRRLQRRNHFRIDIPVSTPLFCQVPRPGHPPSVTLQVKDISAGGVALFDRHLSITDDVGSTLERCVFELDDVGTVVTNLKIRRISDEAGPDAKSVRIVACEFDHPSAQNTILVQNYINRLDRLLNARRRGLD